MNMTGIIKNYLPQKKFGFILGDDQKNYFFHENALISINQMSQIIDGALVEFEPSVSPKGYKATKVVIKSTSDVTKFIVPDFFPTSKDDTIQNWEILQVCDWVVTASDKGNPDAVRLNVKKLASRLGANGLIYMNYHKTTGSEGNYQFTVHNITGRPVVVGRRNLSGTHTANDFADINANCFAYKKQCEEEYATKKSSYFKRLILGLGIIIILTIFLKFVGLGLGLVILLILAIANRPVLEGEWLWK